jgi:hypothetical protein
MPFFFGAPHLYAIEAFWSIQNELAQVTHDRIFSCCAGAIQEGITRTASFCPHLHKEINPGFPVRQLLFVFMLSFALNIVSDLLTALRTES